MSDQQARDLWQELFFSAGLLSAGAIFIAAATSTPVDPDAEFNSRSLPLALAGIIIAYGAFRTLTLLRLASGHRLPAMARDGIVLTIIIPLSAAMALYALLIPVIGYLASTAAVLAAVLYVFGVRGATLIAALAVGAAVISDLIFIRALGMFMPEGWLLERALDLLAFH